jgi:hypothetical protein
MQGAKALAKVLLPGTRETAHSHDERGTTRIDQLLGKSEVDRAELGLLIRQCNVCSDTSSKRENSGNSRRPR